MNALLVPLKFVLTLCCCCNNQKENAPKIDLQREFELAIQDGNLEKVTRLMPISRDFIYDYGSPIHIAVKAGRLNIVKYLIEKNHVGIDSPSRENYDRTPLDYAIFYKKPKIIRYLIFKGANLHLKDDNFRVKTYPFFFAIENSNLKCFKLFLKHGATLDLKDQYEHTVIQVAAQYNKKDILKYALSKTKYRIDDVDHPEESILTNACIYNTGLETIIYIIQLGAKIEDNFFYGIKTENINYLEIVKSLDKASDKLEFVQIEILYNQKCRTNKLINLLFTRTMNLSENLETFCDMCTKTLEICKNNKTFGDKIINNLKIKSLDEKIFYAAIIKKITKNCLDEEKITKVTHLFNNKIFRKNLINSKVKHDALITTIY